MWPAAQSRRKRLQHKFSLSARKTTPSPFLCVFLNLPATYPGDQKLILLLWIGNDFKHCHEFTGWPWMWSAAPGGTAVEFTGHGKQPASICFSHCLGFVIGPSIQTEVRVGERYGRTGTEDGPGEERAQHGSWDRGAHLQPHQGQALGETGHSGQRQSLEEAAKCNMSGAQSGKLGSVKLNQSLFLGLECHTLNIAPLHFSCFGSCIQWIWWVSMSLSGYMSMLWEIIIIIVGPVK